MRLTQTSEHCPWVLQVRFAWHLLTVPWELSYLAVLNYQQQGLGVAALKFLLSVTTSLLVGFYIDAFARRQYLEHAGVQQREQQQQGEQQQMQHHYRHQLPHLGSSGGPKVTGKAP